MILWVASYPKSGNTWLRALISSYFYTEDGNYKENLIKLIDQFPTRKFLKEFNYDKTIVGDTNRCRCHPCVHAGSSSLCCGEGVHLNLHTPTYLDT